MDFANYEKYAYSGPVLIFDTCVEENWKGVTYAVSEKKARNNLMYQWKKKNGRVATSKVTLPGKIEKVN